MDHALAGLHAERGTAGRAHDRECLAARRLHDLLLLGFVDAARVLVQFDEILDVVRREGKNEAVLAGVDDRRGLAGDLLRAHEVLDVLRDDDLHTVILTDTLRQLEHEVQRDRVLRVDENVRLINDDHDLALEAVLHVVIAVFDDLVVDVLEHQQHLRVGNRLVAICQHTLEVEHREVGIRRDRARAVPDVRVASARGELRHVVHQRTEHRADVVVVRALEFLQNRVVQVVEDRVILRRQLGKIGLSRDVEVAVETIQQRVEVLHRVLLAVRQDLTEELLEELQVRGVAAARAAFARLVVVQRSDDVERVQTAILRVTDVDDLAVQIARQLLILVFRVEDEDLRVVRRQVGQNALGGVGLTGTGLTDDDHVGVDALRVTAEEVDEHGDTVVRAQLHAALVADVGEDPRIARRHRVAGDAASLQSKRIEAADLRGNKRLHLLKFHVVQPEAALLPRPADGFLHVRDGREHGLARLLDLVIVARTDDVVRGDVNVALQQRLVVRLQSIQQLLQRGEVLLDLKALGVHARGAPLAAQLHQRAVDAADRLRAIHGSRLDDDLGARDGHNAREPRVAHQRGVVHHAEIVGDDVVHLNAAGCDVHHVRLRPLGVIRRRDLVDLVLVKVQRVGVFEKDRQLLVVQTVYRQLALLKVGQRVADLHLQLPLVALEQHQIVEARDHLFVVAQGEQLVDAVVLDLHARLEFFFRQKSALIGAAQLIQLFVLLVKIALVADWALQLDDVGAVLSVDRAQDASEAALNGVLTTVLAEEAELHRVDLDGGAIVFALGVLNEAVADRREADDVVHVLPGDGGVLGLRHPAHGSLALRGAAGTDGLLLLLGGFLALEDLILFLALFGALLLFRLALLGRQRGFVIFTLRGLFSGFGLFFLL